MMTKEQVEAVLRDEDCLGWGSNEVGLAQTCLALYEREERLIQDLLKLEDTACGLDALRMWRNCYALTRAALKTE